jgi:hypothetical protein
MLVFGVSNLYLHLPSVKKRFEMNFKQAVPEYLVTKRNTILLIAFTTVFAYVFLNIYHPFGLEEWYKVKEWELLVASAVVVLTGMVVVIISRILLFLLKKTHEITLALFIWIIVAEVFLMGIFYTSLEIFIMKDQRSPLALLSNAIQNTSLILLIPYTLCILFFAWNDIKKKFDQVVFQVKDPSELFIPFKDDKGILRITLKCIDVLYLESNDNYLNIHYLDNQKRKIFMIRNSLKNIEKQLKGYPLYRTHRKFTVNIKNVKQMKKSRKGYELVLNIEKEELLPVSQSYEKKIMELMNLK